VRWRVDLRATCAEHQRNLERLMLRLPQPHQARFEAYFYETYGKAVTEPTFIRTSKHDTGFAHSIYGFKLPAGANGPQLRFVKSIPRPDPRDYIAMFTQLQGFSPRLWRACSSAFSSIRGGRLGQGSFSLAKLGFELQVGSAHPRFVALRQQAPTISSFGRAKAVAKPTVEHKDLPQLMTSSDYFPLHDSKRHREFKQKIATALQKARFEAKKPGADQASVDRLKAGLVRKLPSYYSICELGYASLMDMLLQTDLRKSMLIPDYNKKGLLHFVDSIRVLMATSTTPEAESKQTLSRQKVDTARFVQYLRTTGVDKASKAIVAMAVQMNSAVLALHQTDRAHGDLKPDNLMLVPSNTQEHSSDEPLILKLADLDTLSAFTAKAQMQTPKYTVPSNPNGTVRAHENDCYALGRMLKDLVIGLSGLSDFRGACKAKFDSHQMDERRQGWDDVSEYLTQVSHYLTKNAPRKNFESMITLCGVIAFFRAMHSTVESEQNVVTDKPDELSLQRFSQSEQLLKSVLFQAKQTLKLKDQASKTLDQIAYATGDLKPCDVQQLFKAMGLNEKKFTVLEPQLLRQIELVHHWFYGQQCKPLTQELNLDALWRADGLDTLTNATQHLEQLMESCGDLLFDKRSPDRNGVATISDYNTLALLSFSTNFNSFQHDRKPELERLTTQQQLSELRSRRDLHAIFQIVFGSTLNETPLKAHDSLHDWQVQTNVSMQARSHQEEVRRELYGASIMGAVQKVFKRTPGNPSA